jgi:hypothetical protein
MSRTLSASLIALVMTTACSSDKTFRWEEEVVLSTGEQLTLDRTVRLERISAPFNPLKSEWAWRGSTFTVRDGPADVKGARYSAPLLPMLLERDPLTKKLVIVSKPVYCFDYKAYAPDQGWVYLAFALSGDEPMQQVRIPDWAWERRSNLLKPNSDEAPPGRVTPAFASEFNRTKSRGEPWYFQIWRNPPANCRD